MSLLLRVEFIAGSDIEDCCKEAKEFSKQIGKPVVFNFNGVSMLIFSSSDIKDCVEQYHIESQNLQYINKEK